MKKKKKLMRYAQEKRKKKKKKGNWRVCVYLFKLEIFTILPPCTVNVQKSWKQTV